MQEIYWGNIVEGKGESSRSGWGKSADQDTGLTSVTGETGKRVGWEKLQRAAPD